MGNNDDESTLLRLDRGADTSRGATSQLQVRVREYRGHRFVDVRLFWRGDDGELRPGKKGIALRRGELAKVRAALEQAEAELDAGAGAQP